jgi:hypothetical protein
MYDTESHVRAIALFAMQNAYMGSEFLTKNH